MKRTWFVILCTAASGMSCGETTTTQITQLNLDRPVDVAFACHGQMRVTNGGAEISTAQPTLACEVLSPQANPADGSAPRPVTGQENLEPPSWYGFILQSKSGTLALAKWLAVPAQQLEALSLLDADPLTPGVNPIAIGEDPVSVVTEQSGCHVLTANAGSCDLSTLEINSALDDDPSPAVVRRLDVVRTLSADPDKETPDQKEARTIRAKPAAMVASAPLEDPSEIGKTCSEQKPGLVYVAYPGCDLVAGIDPRSGLVMTGIKLAGSAGGLTATVLPREDIDTLSCMNECGGGVPAATARPVALALRAYTAEDNTTRKARLVIGSERSGSLAVVDLDPTTSLPVGAPLVIPLEDNTPATEKAKGKSLGVSAVALSPVIAMGGDIESTNNNDRTPGQYVYAVASDGTVRVADVLTKKMECDTQVDARAIAKTASLEVLQCFGVGDPATPARRAGARGPGIELPGKGVPTSVAIVKGLDQKLTVVQGNERTEQDATQNTGIGHFAIVSSSSGETFVVNVDNDAGPDKPSTSDPFSTAPALVMAHQLRDVFANRDAEPASTAMGADAEPGCKVSDPSPRDGLLAGPPRATAPALRVPSVPGSTIAANKQAALPILRQVECTGSDAPEGTPVSEVQFGASKFVGPEVFPDLATVFSETWTLTWEGLLSQDSFTNIVDGPQVRRGQMRVDGFGMSLLDESQPFCDMGVEPFDIVQLRGCNPANGGADCPSGFECFLHPERRVDTAGVCMPEGQGAGLASPCRDFMISRQRYTVARPDAGKLVLWPRKHVLPSTPVGGCTPDASPLPNTSNMQCKAAADLALQLASPKQPFELTGANAVHDPRIWACEPDELRAPTTPNRCVQKCAFHTTDPANPSYDGKDRDADCDVGTICVGATAGAKAPDGQPLADGTCMESVQPLPACVKGPQRFEVRASEAFVAIGTRSGYVHPIIEGANGQCVRNPSANPLEVGRIPLQAPACTSGANPCEPTDEQEQVKQVELVPNYRDRNTCELGSPETVLMDPPRVAPAIRFSNRSMTLTLVDPYYPGDQTCVGDRAGALGKIPVVVPNYQLTFDQRAGFSALQLGIAPAFPVKVVRGPSESIWVMDAGDFLSQTLGVPSTTGRVFRVEPQSFDESKVLR